nr:hypothetical protein [uncultured Acidocella sp.]
MEAMQSPKPQTVLNNKFRGLRRRKDEPLKALREWLTLPSTIEHAQRSGAHWALSIWHKAICEILAGETAHEVFGMARRGRPRNPGFTATESAALFVDEQMREGSTVDAALAKFEGQRSTPIDERSVRRKRAEHKKLGVKV